MTRLFPLQYISSAALIATNSISDHAPTCLTFSLKTLTKGRGFWQFLNELLKQPEFVLQMNNTIQGEK